MSILRGVVEEILGDRYEIQSSLGGGSFGLVYRAKDKFLNRVVAVKSVCLDDSPDLIPEEDLRKRFLREAQVAAQLRHPNIVTIYDIVSTDRASVIIMEFVEGVTLQAHLSSKKRLSLSETIEALSQTARALDYAHERKVVHRDVKPANIMITASKEVRVMDFGIAKTEVSDLTITGVILGTPDYMSPEQAKGEMLDGRSDIFSLGSVLYECLTGEQPFQSRNVTGVLLRIVNEPPPDVDWPSLGLPSGLDGVVKQALAKDPSHRYQSGAAFIEALETLAQEIEEGPGVEIGKEEYSDVAPSGEIETSPESQSETAHLKALREEKRPLVFADSSQEILDTLDLGRDEAFIISCIDGQATPGDLLSGSPSPDRDTARTLLSLIEIGLIKLRAVGDESTESEASVECEPDDRIVQEIEELFELSRSQDHAQILGIEDSADSKEIEQAFKEKFVRYSPDTYPQIEDPEFRQKLRQLLKLSYEAFVALSKQAGGIHRSQSISIQEDTSGIVETPSLADRKRLAEEVFERARRTFLTQDYWETIQLCRHVIELYGEEAKYHHLLGLALSQNVNWQEDAKESLRKAAELDPENLEYSEILGGDEKDVPRLSSGD